MKYCGDCGIKLDEGEKFCHACGTQLVETPVVQKNNKKYISPEDNRKGNTLGILSL